MVGGPDLLAMLRKLAPDDAGLAREVGAASNWQKRCAVKLHPKIFL